MSDAGPGLAGGRVDRMLVGRYQLTRFIASGGMAEVWEGRDIRLARLVVIKMPLPHVRQLDHAMTRFRREAVAAAKLSHPNVVAVYDTGTDGPDTFIVMERVVGESLAELLARDGPMSVERAVTIAAQVAAALDFAHRAGVVHRDVKPANLLVTSDGVVKVADFGIAKAVQDEGLTDTRATLGTARYAAPEQLDGGTPDARTDVYALGVVLYEMLCGRAPFRADSEIAVAMAHIRDAPVPPSKLRPDLPGWLEGAVLRALAKRPDDRFVSAAAMRAVLLLGVSQGGGGLAGPGLAGAGAAESGAGQALGSADHSVGPTDPTSVRFEGAFGGRAAVSGTSVPPEPPPHLAPRPRPTGRSRPGHQGRFSGRRRLPLVVGGVVLVALVVMVALLSQLTQSPKGSNGSGAGPGPAPNAGSPATTSLQVAGGVLFDHTVGVPGNQDPGDNPGQIPNLYDGNPSTSWTTAQYKGRFAQAFGNLKPGLGFVLELANVDKLSQLQVLSSPSTLGWQASVYVSNRVHCTLAGWGSPVASQTATTTTTTFDLGKVQGSEVLVWLTKLGPAAQATLDEATLTGSVGSRSATVPGTAVCGGPGGSSS